MSPPTIHYEAPSQFPESCDYDSKHKRFLVGSLAKSTVIAVDEHGKVTPFVADPDYAGCATLGVQVDLPHNRAIVTIHSNNPAKPYDGVAAYDLDTAKRIYLVDLGSLPVENPPRKDLPPFANDAVAAPDGRVFVTDTNRSLLWKVEKDGSDPTVFASDALFDAFPKTYNGAWDLGLNGIVVHPTGGYIITSCVRNGKFFKVPLAGGPAAEVVASDDYNYAAVDGIRWRPDGKIVAIADDKAWLIESTDDWATCKLVETKPLNGAHTGTAVAVREGIAYVNYGFFGEFFAGNATRTTFVLERVDFDFDAKKH